MSAPIFFAAYFQLSIERAGRRRNDIGAQDAEPFTRLHQFFVGKRSDKFTVIVFAEFTESNRTGHRDTHDWSRRGKEGNSNTRLVRTPHGGRLIRPLERFKPEALNALFAQDHAGRLRHRVCLVSARKMLVMLKRYWRRFVVLNDQIQRHGNVTSTTALDSHCSDLQDEVLLVVNTMQQLKASQIDSFDWRLNEPLTRASHKPSIC